MQKEKDLDNKIRGMQHEKKAGKHGIHRSQSNCTKRVSLSGNPQAASDLEDGDINMNKRKPYSDSEQMPEKKSMSEGGTRTKIPEPQQEGKQWSHQNRNANNEEGIKHGERADGDRNNRSKGKSKGGKNLEKGREQRATSQHRNAMIH